MQPGSVSRFMGWGNYPAHGLLGMNVEPYEGPTRVLPAACREEGCGGDLVLMLSEHGTGGVETHCEDCQVCDRYDHGLSGADLEVE